MIFSYTKVGNSQKPGSTFAKIERKETVYEIETKKVIEYSSLIPRGEQETVIVLDQQGTHIYSCRKKDIHNLLKKSMHPNSGWVVNRICVYKGQPVEVEMQHKDNKVSVRS